MVLSTAFIFLLDNITVQGLAFFAPTIVGTIYPNAEVVQLQLHTVPPYVVGAFATVLLPLLSTIFDKRLIFFIISAPFMSVPPYCTIVLACSILTFPPRMIGYIVFLATEDPRARYGATFLIAVGAFSFGALCNAQGSANVVSDTARSAAM